jgi:uncharacterized protein
MADYKLEIYKDKKGEFRWRRTASNGEIVGASSEGYQSKKHCEENANRDMSKDKWEFYKDKAGQFRWRAFSTHNGRQVGKATESFASSSGCKNNARINGFAG